MRAVAASAGPPWTSVAWLGEVTLGSAPYQENVHDMVRALNRGGRIRKPHKALMRGHEARNTVIPGRGGVCPVGLTSRHWFVGTLSTGARIGGQPRLQVVQPGGPWHVVEPRLRRTVLAAQRSRDANRRGGPEGRRRRRRAGPGEKYALGTLGAELGERVARRLRFNALDDQREADSFGRTRRPPRRIGDGLRPCPGADDGGADPDFLDRQVSAPRQGADPGTEVANRQTRTEPSKLVSGGVAGLPLHRRTHFRDLEHKKASCPSKALSVTDQPAAGHKSRNRGSTSWTRPEVTS